MCACYPHRKNKVEVIKKKNFIISAVPYGDSEPLQISLNIHPSLTPPHLAPAHHSELGVCGVLLYGALSVKS
jgi:hypothetical protein